MKTNEKRKSRKIYYFGYPEYGNLGDHAIAVATIDYLHKKFPDTSVVKVPMFKGICSLLTTTYYENIINDNDILILTGGGNMGNQYIGEEYLRQLVIRHFPNNTIISFPQTINFVDNTANIINDFDCYLLQKYNMDHNY